MKFKIKLNPSSIGKAVDKAVEQEIDDFKAVELAKARLKKADLRLMNRPRHPDGEPLEPVLPLNITDLTSEALGQLHGEFAIMTQFAIQITSISSVERAARARIDKYTRARVHLLKSGTIADKAAKVEVDMQVRDSGFKLLQGESTEMLTEALLNSYIVGKDVTSREMTRRQNELGRLPQ